MYNESVSPSPCMDCMADLKRKESINLATPSTRHSFNFEINANSDNEEDILKIRQLFNDTLVLLGQTSINIEYLRQNSSSNTYYR
jgi:hypothetical protein